MEVGPWADQDNCDGLTTGITAVIKLNDMTFYSNTPVLCLGLQRLCLDLHMRAAAHSTRAHGYTSSVYGI